MKSAMRISGLLALAFSAAAVYRILVFRSSLPHAVFRYRQDIPSRDHLHHIHYFIAILKADSSYASCSPSHCADILLMETDALALAGCEQEFVIAG